MTASGRASAPMVRPRHLITLKTVAGRPIDLEDATALLLLYPDVDTAVLQRDGRIAVIHGGECRRGELGGKARW